MATTFSRLSSIPEELGEIEWLKLTWDAWFDKLRIPDQTTGDHEALPASIDPAAIETSEGDVGELAGLSASDSAFRGRR